MLSLFDQSSVFIPIFSYQYDSTILNILNDSSLSFPLNLFEQTQNAVLRVKPDNQADQAMATDKKAVPCSYDVALLQFNT